MGSIANAGELSTSGGSTTVTDSTNNSVSITTYDTDTRVTGGSFNLNGATVSGNVAITDGTYSTGTVTYCYISGAAFNISSVTTDGSTFIHLKTIDTPPTLNNCIVTGVTITGATITGANITGATITGGILTY
jgi:uncharacterized protein YjbI with pentapeptide repeats